MTKYDTIIVAGDKDSSFNINGQNKSLLKIKDIPIIIYILRSLEKVASINKIFIIGPKNSITQAIKKHIPQIITEKKVIILEQKNTLFENFWYAFNSSFSNQNLNELKEMNEYKEKMILVMPGDIPLVTSAEVEYFISGCDTSSYDYFLGLTPEGDLTHFYPTDNEPGIKMAYVNFKEDRYRGNNLHLIRPVKIANSYFTQKIYECRYQKELKNMLKIAFETIKSMTTIAGLWFYFLTLAAQFFSLLELTLLCDLVRRFIPVKKVENALSKILNTRFTSVRVPYPGAVLDIDNEKQYKAMDIMFDKWQMYLSQGT